MWICFRFAFQIYLLLLLVEVSKNDIAIAYVFPVVCHKQSCLILRTFRCGSLINSDFFVSKQIPLELA